MRLWSWYCWSWQRHRAGSDRQEFWQLCRVRLLQLLLTARYLTFRIIDRWDIEATVRMHTVSVGLPLIHQKRLTVERLGGAVVLRLTSLSVGRSSR